MYTPFDATLAVSDAAVDSYLAARPYPAGGTLDERLEAIGTQLWISKFMNWWDAWADWRRTGYSVLVPTNYPGNVTGGYDSPQIENTHSGGGNESELCFRRDNA